MEIVVVIGVVVGVVLLFGILGAQQERAKIEAVQVAHNIVRDKTAAFVADAGTESDARRNGRLVEYVQAAARHGGLDATAARALVTDNKDLHRDIVQESFKRGVRCDFLKPEDFRDLYSGHPGPEPEVETYCTDRCDAYNEVEWMPGGLTVCPFCGAETESLDPDDAQFHEAERATWRRDMDSWERYHALYPEIAAPLESQSLELHGNANKKRREHYERLLAAHREQVTTD